MLQHSGVRLSSGCFLLGPWVSTAAVSQSEAAVLSITPQHRWRFAFPGVELHFC